MIGAEAKISNGYAAYQSGDLATARKLLEPVPHPQAWHLLGLVERKAGRFDRANQWLNKAEKKDPRNPEIANNQGRVAMDAGDGVRAEACFRRALNLRPDWPPAVAGLARSLNEQKRWREAVPVWETAIRLTPNDRSTRYYAAMATLETGQVEQAAQLFDGLIQAGLQDPAVYFMRGRARVGLSDIAGAMADFQHAWRAQKTGHTLRNLSNMLWMLGDDAGFHDLMATVPDPLGGLKMYLLWKSGDSDAALEAWQALPEAYRNDPETLASKSNIHRERGEADLALETAHQAQAIAPGKDTIDYALAGAQLMQGDPAAALRTVKPWRRKEPNVQSWIALEATALRLADPDKYAALVQMDRFVRAFELPLPKGFASIQDFNAALIAAIAPNQTFARRPLDQTLRGGTQTARDLVHAPDPVIQAYLQALDAPIRAYLAEIGHQADHPLTRRNTGAYRFNGCWSVTLKGGGRHVNHVHPNGWISSAYYASVPEETLAGASKAGWIKFGEPPFTTTPELGPEKWVQPKPGMLVLFPSFMWHGTDPISDGSERVTVPFDLVPD
ncbi:MAG: tetratricopeptide repeat protein [Pseudomonadota bacterium]